MNWEFLQKYSLRPLTAADTDEIFDLCRENEQFYRYHPPCVTRQSILEDMAALPPGKSGKEKHYLGFFDGGKLIAVLDLIENYPQESVAYIGFFMMRKALQGRGIGTELVDGSLNELRRSGCRKVRLAVDKGNPQSRTFWEKNGFVLTGEEMPHGDSAYLPMERGL